METNMLSDNTIQVAKSLVISLVKTSMVLHTTELVICILMVKAPETITKSMTQMATLLVGSTTMDNT